MFFRLRENTPDKALAGCLPVPEVSSTPCAPRSFPTVARQFISRVTVSSKSACWSLGSSNVHDVTLV